MIKMIKRFFCPLLILSVFAAASGVIYSAVEYQRTGSTRINAQKGYDFYDNNDVKTAYSIPNGRGGCNYYDRSGNKIGSLKRPDRSKEEYIFYDANDIKKGTLKKMPSGVYYYKDILSGKLIDSVPQVSGKIGSLSPDVFQGKDVNSRGR